MGSIGVRAPSELGGRWPFCPKKNYKTPKASVVYTYSNRSKNKNVSNSQSNETVIIPETKRNSYFLEPPRELVKIAFKNRTVREITAFDWGEGNDFWFELSGGSKNCGFEKSGFHCSYFETLHTPSLWLQKETVNCCSYEKYRKILNRHFAEPFKRALFRATTKT